MAKAVGGPQAPRHQPPSNVAMPNTVTELIGRLEALARANEEARSAVFNALESGDDPDYASAYEALFAAVMRLSPRHSAQALADLLRDAQSLLPGNPDGGAPATVLPL